MRKYRGEGKFRTITTKYRKHRKKMNKMQAASRRINRKEK